VILHILLVTPLGDQLAMHFGAKIGPLLAVICRVEEQVSSYSNSSVRSGCFRIQSKNEGKEAKPNSIFTRLISKDSSV
jgi:hypothetical protein